MLIVFEMLFFGLLDLGTKNYLFTGAMQYLLMEVLCHWSSSLTHIQGGAIIGGTAL